MKESRYKFTSIIQDDRLQTASGQTLGIFHPPFPSNPDTTYRSIKSGEARRLYILAQEYYNDVDLWWVIAWQNHIRNPLREVIAGMKLNIPNSDQVQAAYSDDKPFK